MDSSDLTSDSIMNHVEFHRVGSDTLSATTCETQPIQARQVDVIQPKKLRTGSFLICCACFSAVAASLDR